MAGGRKHRHFWKWAAAAIVMVLPIGLGVAPSGATQFPDRGHYSGTDSYSFDDCGFTIDVEVTFEGVHSLREGKGATDTAFYLHDNYSFVEIDTNHETGEWFLVRGDGNFIETKAIPLGGNLFEFDSVEAGQPFVVEDAAGNVVIRDRGSIQRRIVFDTGGDDVPGGEFVEELSTVVHGPHPGFFVDYCEVANDLIGP